MPPRDNRHTVEQGWQPEDSFLIKFDKVDDVEVFVLSRRSANDKPQAIMVITKADLEHYGYEYAECELEPHEEEECERLVRMEAFKLHPRRPEVVRHDYHANKPSIFRFFTRDGHKDFRISTRNVDEFRKQLDALRSGGINLRPASDQPKERPVINDPS